MAQAFQLKTQEIAKLLASFLGGRYVLVVDPSANYRTSLKQFLANLRVTHVRCVGSVKEARRVMLTTKVAFLLVEWLCEEENGLQFCRELNQSKEFRDIPYLLMTSENLRQDVILASEVGVDGYLLKPFSYEDFVIKLHSMIKEITSPNPVNQLVNQGMRFLRVQQWEQAEHFFNEVLEQEYKSAKAATGLAQIYLAREQEGRAITYLEKALSFNPNYMSAHRILLHIYEKQRNFKGMLNEAKILNAESPDNPRYTLMLATLYLREKNLDESEHFFKRTIQLSPSIAESYKGLGHVAIERKDHEKAAKMFKKALDLDKNDISSLNALGLAYIHLGMYEEGIQKYKIALNLHPNDYRILYNLGQAYEKQNQLKEAFEHYEKSLKLNPNYEKAQRALARVRPST